MLESDYAVEYLWVIQKGKTACMFQHLYIVHLIFRFLLKIC
jgi:hypothetical protein